MRAPLPKVFLILVLGSILYAQDVIPRPYLYAGGEGMGSGYAPFALIGGGGFRIDSSHFLLDAVGWYDNGHKTNDNTQPNPKGHDRGLVGSAYYRLGSGWAFGAGARWSELSTTNYKKSSWEPTFGGNKDFFHPGCTMETCADQFFSMRIGIDYMLKGSNWQNGTQGMLFSLYLPSPSVQHHIFYRETVGIYRFYDTVTDRADPRLTREEMSHHSFDSFAEFTIMYRF
jgi:hypothetical protein